jgi:hypothetical protein
MTWPIVLLIFALTLVSGFWFAIGYGAAMWAVYCTRSGVRPVPQLPFRKRENGQAEDAPEPAPRRTGI